MKRSKGDVMYTVPNKKKPIAYSTKATNDLIVVLAQEYETISDVSNAISYDQDAKDVLQKYIDLGYGDVIAREWFR